MAGSRPTIATTSYWTGGVTPPRYPRVAASLSVDAVVIGAGITGVTAAYLMADAGLRVALVERDRCGSGETGHFRS